MTAPSKTLQRVLNAYDVGAISSLAGAGGTAGKTWRVRAGGGEYLLRLRGTRTSGPARLAYDHGLRAHLVARGVPTARAVRTREGALWVRAEGRVYELYPFVAGRPFDAQRPQELAVAAEALAAFHRAAYDYRPPARGQPRVAQYTRLGFSDEVSDRMDDPRLQLLNLHGVRALARTPAEEALVDRCIARVKGLQRTYGSAAYERLTGYVIHGDYTPANVVYSPEGEIAGIFDFDWAMEGPRCLDIAYGLCFFATQPRQIDSGSIWSLTDAAAFTVERCALFLRAYYVSALHPDARALAPFEREALPRAFASLWLSKRLEGMAKVRPRERFHFFARDIEGPLRWMDAHWAEVERAAFEPPSHSPPRTVRRGEDRGGGHLHLIPEPKDTLTMDAKERVLAACAFRRPDRIPRIDNFWTVPAGWEERLGEPLDRISDVAIWCPDEGTWPTRARWLEERGGWIYEVDTWGRTIRRRTDAYFSETLKVALPPGIDPETVRFDPPDLDRRYARDEAALREVKRRHCLFGKTGGPYLRSTFVRGEAQFLIDIGADPGLARAIADRVGDHLTAVGVQEIHRWSLYETGIWIYDDMAYNNGPMIGPGAFERVFLPAYRRMIRAYKEAGARYVFLHSDGDVRLLLPMLVDAGIDGLNPLEPRAQMDIAALRRQYPSLILAGGMDNTDTLVRGPAERVRAEARAIIDLGRDGGVIIGTHSISPEIPFELYRAYHETCRTYGVLGGGA